MPHTPRGRAPQVQQSGRPNTIGLQDQALEKLYEELDAKGEGGEANPKRKFVRWAFRIKTVLLTVHQPGGSQSNLKVACRNLSAGGMSVLHSAYAHPGTKCTAILPRADGAYVSLGCEVTRCNHVSGTIHEIGVRFEESLNIRDYVQMDPFSDTYSIENVDPDSLRGCLVHVEDSEMDRRIVKHYLRETQLRIREADSADGGMEMVREGCDLVLCDFMLNGSTGADLVKTMREEGITTPVIMCTADTSVLTRNSLSEINANAIMAKPIEQRLLLRAIAEFLIAEQEGYSLTCNLDKDDPAAAMVADFIKELQKYAEQLEATIESDDPDVARAVLMKIKGTAPSLGFEGIAGLANAAANAVAASMSTTEAVRPLREVIAACQRVRAA